MVFFPDFIESIVMALNPGRKLSLTQIAEKLDVSPAALSEILRKTLRKIVKDYVESNL